MRKKLLQQNTPVLYNNIFIFLIFIKNMHIHENQEQTKKNNTYIFLYSSHSLIRNMYVQIYYVSI